MNVSVNSYFYKQSRNATEVEIYRVRSVLDNFYNNKLWQQR